MHATTPCPHAIENHREGTRNEEVSGQGLRHLRPGHQRTPEGPRKPSRGSFGSMLRRRQRRRPCAPRARFAAKQSETTRCSESVSGGQNMFGPVRAMGALRSQRGARERLGSPRHDRASTRSLLGRWIRLGPRLGHIRVRNDEIRCELVGYVLSEEHPRTQCQHGFPPETLHL